MIRENWFDWAVDVAAVTDYGVHEVLDCATHYSAHRLKLCQ